MKKVGLFFGTFDPIHIGHERIAKYFLERYFDEIWFVITPLNPDKINENLTNQSIRLEMSKVFCGNEEKFKNVALAYEVLSDNEKRKKYDNNFPLEYFDLYSNPIDLFDKIIRKSDIIFLESKINNNSLYNDLNKQDNINQSIFFQKKGNMIMDL